MATENRGFASMDPEKQRQIASEGGKASHGGRNQSQDDNKQSDQNRDNSQNSGR